MIEQEVQPGMSQQTSTAGTYSYIFVLLHSYKFLRTLPMKISHVSIFQSFKRDLLSRQEFTVSWNLNALASERTLHCLLFKVQFSSVQFSSVHSLVVSNSLRSHELQHTMPPCPSPTRGVHSDPCRSSQWWHTAISSSVVPFSCPQSLPASKSFPMSQLFAWGSQSTGVSALASFLPKKSQSWSPSEWTDWISLQSKGLSRVFSNTTIQKHQFFGAQPSSQSNSYLHTWPLGKP